MLLWRNTVEKYGAVAKGFHWLMAALIVGLLCLGLYMEDLGRSPLKLQLVFWHKSLGIAVLALVVLRILWRFLNVPPSSLPNHKPWEKILARIAHAALYAGMIGMPLSGWAMSSAKGYPVSVFGWFTLPGITPKNHDLGEFMGEVHEVTAWILIGAIALHAAGAIKHHVIDKDSTLRRMLPFGRIALAALLLTLAAGAARAQEPEEAPAWIIDPLASRLTFEGRQMGSPFTGSFSRFRGHIHFDPDNLAASHAEITIDMASVDTENPERDESIIDKDWFSVSSFPEARFETTSFEKGADGSYLAHGKLTIRDVTLPVDLPFTLETTQNEKGQTLAEVNGAVILKRLDFGIGQGEWKDTKSVGNDVTVTVSLHATRQE